MKKLKFLSVVMMIIMWLGTSMGIDARQKIDKNKKSAYKSQNMEKPYSLKTDRFYRLARLIMTKEEVEIYKHLPDHNARVNFADDFWKKRDPSPGTPENESKQEFYLRIAYANKWFKETPKGEGWNTERGRILLQLGFPDQRKLEDRPETRNGRVLNTRSIRREYWIYDRYQMMLFFHDGTSRDKLSLHSVPTNLSLALEKAKFSLNLADKSSSKKNFKFNANYKSGQVTAKIPVKKVSFEEKDNMLMTAQFGVVVYVYKDGIKVDEISMDKNFSMDKDKLLKMKAIELSVPYSTNEKGKYYFDVVIEEKSSAAKFRDFAKYKI